MTAQDFHDSPPQDWTGGPGLTDSPAHELTAHGLTARELTELNEEAPLRLTDSQRRRLLALLTDELGGPISANVVMARIEREV